ncbi:phospholipase C [Aneurinibacillus terranovensis]|uniref:phospholipase C n=1 Tax=Aneurinibacillus terranovensis TaxID=278991 RepID=UPI000412B25F|nr:alkaline phosphatase family protein [Aneurinibacillus terranovensis]
MTQKSVRDKLASIAAAVVVGYASLCAWAGAPTSVKAKAAPDARLTATPVKHTVVIYQENRSFDHYFGTYPNAPGFHALPGTPSVNGIPAGSYNLDRNGRPVYPYLFPAHQKKTSDVNHGYKDMIKAYNNGLMDKFYEVSEKHIKGSGIVAMGYYDYHTIPAYWQYAQHFALADNWYQPIFGPSTPGALYLVAAQSGTKDRPITWDPGPKNNFGADAEGESLTYNLTYTNIGDKMTAAGIPWAWYQGGYAAKDETYAAHHNPFQYFQNFEDGKYRTNLKDIAQFQTDIANRRLPAVSFLKAEYPENEHPGYSSPEGQDFTVRAVNAIMKSPYWKDTAIIITYDESGGYWDHVPPPQVAPGPDGLKGEGPRIPALVISPYAKRNYVSHVQYDTTSILKFIEWNHHLAPLNNRDKNANNILDMFDFGHPDFTPYMYHEGNLATHKSYGTR